MKNGKKKTGFCTVINCMDGRVQLPVIHYVRNRFRAEHVDSITEMGPNRILAEAQGSPAARSILERLLVSLTKHDSVGVAVVGHHDCAGNPAPKEEQIVHTNKAVDYIRQRHGSVEIIGLWVDEDWEVHDCSER